MEILFRKQFWIFHVLCVGVLGVMLAKSTTSVAGHFIEAALEKPEKDASKRAALPTSSGNRRDFEAASDANIFGAKREDPIPVAPVATAVCAVDEDCPEGQRCVPSADNPLKMMCEAKPGEMGDCGNAERSTLTYQLLGTTVFDNPEDSIATLVDKSEGRRAEGDLFALAACESPPPLPADGGVPDLPTYDVSDLPCNDLNGNTLLRIDIDRVYVQNATSNTCEYISLDEPPEDVKTRRKPRVKKKKKRGKRSSVSKEMDEIADGISKTGPNSYTVQQESVNKALGSLSKLATQARIVPAFENGEAVGFKLFSIRPGSLYSKLGLQNGDIIQKVNGYEITSPDKALGVYQKLKDGKSFSLDFKRRGGPQTMEYSITQ